MNNRYQYKVPAYLLLLAIFALIISCEKKPTDYRSFLDGHEVVYPGTVSGIEADPGDHRLLLTWRPNADPSLKQYIVYWNSGADSIVVPAASHLPTDTVKAAIGGLEEGTHAFVVYSFDDKGNRSIPINVENIKIYGDKYRSSILNRATSDVKYDNNILTITWNVPDTVNVGTEVKYTDGSGETKSVVLPADSSKLVISDWKLPTKIYYRSSYKPESHAIDTFRVSYYDSLTVSNLPADKSTWKQVLLLGDAVVDAYGTSLSNIWDGKPGAYPEVYHSDGAYIPHTFTIDLGKTYAKLTKFEEWGRTDFDGHNPDDFEVWGIADTTGAVPALRPDDPGWKDETMAKGWTLLTEVKRNDDGIAGVQTDVISNPPPVRFIRIRVLHAVDGDTFSHMSEISFWYNP